MNLHGVLFLIAASLLAADLVGWVERSETHRRGVVGRAQRDPPYEELLAADDAPKTDTDGDKLQGTWKIAAEVENGKETPPARNEKVRIRFTADKMIVTEGDEKHQATYKLDPERIPSTIEVTPDDGPNKGKKALGIYQLSGDTLTICLALGEGKDRPGDFTAKADSGRVLFTLERIKP